MCTTTTTTTTTISRVRNYQGSNSFIMKMRDALNRWGNLTQKQLEAAEKCLNSEVKVDVETLSEDMKKIAKYEGESTFVKDIKSKLMTYGTLTDRQVQAVLKQIEKEENKAKTLKIKIPTPGETIKIGRKIGQQLKEKYGLKFNPILIDITKVTAVSPKAVQFVGKMTIKRGDVCMCCAKTLTDEFSMLTRMGKICANHMEVEYITDASQAERFREEYLKRVEEIGSMEFWVPKNQIKTWGSVTEMAIESLF
jgi:ribosomal protein L16/L10AE